MPNVKLTTPQWIVGVASALGFVSLFFTWFAWDCSGLSCGYIPGTDYTGFSGWGWFYLLATLVALVLLALRVFADRVKLPALPVQDWQIYTGAGAAMILFVLLAFMFKPGGDTYLGLDVGSHSAGFGWFTALFMAIGVTTGGWMSKADPQPATSPLTIGSPPAGGTSPPAPGA